MNKSLYSFTLASSNKKTGPIPTVMASRDTCPESCPLYKGGCYALIGPIAWVWRKVSERGIDFAELCRSISALPERQIWRYAVAGDLPGKGKYISGRNLKAMTLANVGRRGFTYTHKPVLGNSALSISNRKLIQEANTAGFTINLSANTLQQADEYISLKIAPVCVIVSHKPASGIGKEELVWKNTATPKGVKVIQCPAEYTNTLCYSCGGAGGPLCARKDRDYVIGFTTHGVAKNKAAAVASGLKIIQ